MNEFNFCIVVVLRIFSKLPLDFLKQDLDCSTITCATHVQDVVMEICF